MWIAFDALLYSNKREGINTYIMNLIFALSKLDLLNIKIDIYVNKDFSDTFNFSNDSIKIIPIRIISNWHRILTQFLLRFKLLKKYDFLLSPDYPITFFLSKKTKKIIVIHDITVMHRNKDFSKVKSAVKIWGIKRAIKIADIIVTPSIYVKENICNSFDIHEKKITHIYEGAAPIFFERELLTKQNVKRILNKYMITNNFHLFVGTQMPRKNLVGLIRAFEKVANLISDDLVIIGGRSWLNKELNKILEVSLFKNRIHFCGFVPDNELPAFYKAAKSLILPSFEEGFGLPIVEAFAVGCPVITSNITATYEIGGKNAYLIDPYNLDSISEALVSFSKNSKVQKHYKELSKNLSGKYSWQNTAKEFIKLIKRNY